MLLSLILKSLLIFNLFIYSINALNQLKIYYFDVGQADSQLIVFPSGYTILIDVGEIFGYDTYDNVYYVSSRIKQILGKSHINTIVLSHVHMDHIGRTHGGIFKIEDFGITFDKIIDRDIGYFDRDGECNNNTIDWNIVGTMTDEAVEWVCNHCNKRNKTNIFKKREIAKICSKEQINPPDENSEVEIVMVDAYGTYMPDGRPVRGNYYGEEYPPSENDYSISLRIQFGNFVYSTSGDLDGEYSVSSYGQTYNNVEKICKDIIGEVDLYKANHHGSDHSSSKEFIEVLKPTVSVIPCGEGNSYGHPRLAAVQNMNLTSKNIYSSQNCQPDLLDIFNNYKIMNGDIVVTVEDNYFYVSDVKMTKIDKFEIKKNKPTRKQCGYD